MHSILYYYWNREQLREQNVQYLRSLGLYSFGGRATLKLEVTLFNIFKLPGILIMDMTLDDKLMSLPNDDKHNYINQ